MSIDRSLPMGGYWLRALPKAPDKVEECAIMLQSATMEIQPRAFVDDIIDSYWGYCLMGQLEDPDRKLLRFYEAGEKPDWLDGDVDENPDYHYETGYSEQGLDRPDDPLQDNTRLLGDERLSYGLSLKAQKRAELEEKRLHELHLKARAEPDNHLVNDHPRNKNRRHFTWDLERDGPVTCPTDLDPTWTPTKRKEGLDRREAEIQQLLREWAEVEAAMAAGTRPVCPEAMLGQPGPWDDWDSAGSTLTTADNTETTKTTRDASTQTSVFGQEQAAPSDLHAATTPALSEQLVFRPKSPLVDKPMI
ncbi:hypothetical protein D6C98_04162 [Aureobasidium pullulans]|uniref:Uncharacterized protein n=1 Tax=Aureobasidium pullulans TaxID=5580 RepID=A0A4S9TAW0_AURPU|nr:hypothetical protein D6D29_09373 [Aureobasidium pullulans]THW19491.1 hypothetical protein D6D24_02819 [Aureobasidium pullulans]THW41943.1 hypothetical protein D6D22_05156 [Aureobasidium pullulans]THY55489.1 hypothetical protein D6C98_04162 [Aureobasidium pullulans]THY82956.1 hypothetical protein D6C93_09037 [Aureobasidium pullulans]